MRVAMIVNSSLQCATICLAVFHGPLHKPKPKPAKALLKGSWDLVTTVTNKVTMPIITYNPN